MRHSHIYSTSGFFECI